MPGQRGAERGTSKSLSDRRKRPYLLRFSTPQVAGPDLLRDVDSRYRASHPRRRPLFLVDGHLHISRKAPAREALGRATWSPTSTPPIATARRARYSPGGRSRPAFPEPAGTSNPRSLAARWQAPEASVFARHCVGQRVFDGVPARAAVHRSDRADSAAFRANLAARPVFPQPTTKVTRPVQ